MESATRMHETGNNKTQNDRNPEFNEVENAGDEPEVILVEEPEVREAEESEKVRQLEDRLVRLMAEFENFRKRSAKEKAQERQRGRREAIEQLLPVYDSLTLGLLSLKPDDPSRSGMQAIHQQLLTSFEELGLIKVATKGEKFDPERHEAIANIPSGDVPEGVIIEESRSGFEDEIGLLRPAQVVVSAGAPS